MFIEEIKRPEKSLGDKFEHFGKEGAKAGAYKLMEKYSKITKAERKAIDEKVDAFVSGLDKTEE